MKTPETFTLPGNTYIRVAPGSVHTNLKVDGKEDDLAAEYNAAIDGLTSLLLALASAGVDLSTSEYHQAVETAVESICNQYS